MHCQVNGEYQYRFQGLFPREFCSELYYVCIFNEKCILLLWHIEIHGFLRKVVLSAPTPLRFTLGLYEIEI